MMIFQMFGQLEQPGDKNEAQKQEYSKQLQRVADSYANKGEWQIYADDVMKAGGKEKVFAFLAEAWALAAISGRQTNSAIVKMYSDFKGYLQGKLGNDAQLDSQGLRGYTNGREGQEQIINICYAMASQEGQGKEQIIGLAGDYKKAADERQRMRYDERIDGSKSIWDRHKKPRNNQSDAKMLTNAIMLAYNDGELGEFLDNLIVDGAKNSERKINIDRIALGDLLSQTWLEASKSGKYSSEHIANMFNEFRVYLGSYYTPENFGAQKGFNAILQGTKTVAASSSSPRGDGNAPSGNIISPEITRNNIYETMVSPTTLTNDDIIKLASISATQNEAYEKKYGMHTFAETESGKTISIYEANIVNGIIVDAQIRIDDGKTGKTASIKPIFDNLIKNNESVSDLSKMEIVPDFEDGAEIAIILIRSSSEIGKGYVFKVRFDDIIEVSPKTAFVNLDE